MGFNGLPSIDGEEMGILTALVKTGLAKSNSEARNFVKSNAVLVNGEKVSDDHFMLNKDVAIEGKYIVLRRGKKLYALIKVI
jgi:tyrosyl-tRNA synthetase